MARPDRPAPAQHLLTVESRQQISPHLVRLTLRGDSVPGFPETGYTDSYLKLVFVDPALGLEPPYDVRALRETLPAEQQPVVRTYTIRRLDRERGSLEIDFVTHGDVGVAGPWAQQAAAGDTLAAQGPGGGYAPDPDAPFHLLLGDLSAVPAIAAALEALPADATGLALLHSPSEEDRISLRAPAGVELRWIVDADEDEHLLADALGELEWPAGTQVFAHGERGAMKAVRRVLREREVPRESLSISAYWARGRTEDAFQAEKREPIGQID